MIQLLVGMLATVAMVQHPGAADEGRGPRVRYELQGLVGSALRDVTRNWLMGAPAANPALLGMFRDRDRSPYRDLLPWSGEFAGKYLTGAVAVLRLTDDPALEAHLARFVADLIALQDADGYLGPFPRGHSPTGTGPNIAGKPGGTWVAWGHYHALLAWEASTGYPAGLHAATKFGDLLCDRFLDDRRPRMVDTGSAEMNLAPAHGLLPLHRPTMMRRYLQLAGQLIAEVAALDSSGRPLACVHLRQELAGVPFFRTPRPRRSLSCFLFHDLTSETALPRLALDRHPTGAKAWARRSSEAGTPSPERP